MAHGIITGRHRYGRNSVLIETDPAGYELWDLTSDRPGGRWWVPSGRIDEIAAVLAEQDQNFYGDAQTGVRSGDIVIDCGAHFGGFAKPSALDRGANLVVAMEVVGPTLECLRRNCAGAIADGRLVICGKAAWSSVRTLELIQGKHCPAVQVGLTNKDRNIPGRMLGQVQATTIDQMVEDLGLPGVDFIKMDIEGAEQHALLGAARTLRRYQPRLGLAAYHRRDDHAVLSATILAANPAYTVLPRLSGCALVAFVAE